MTRAEITRRKNLAERYAKMMCRMRGRDPNERVPVAALGYKNITRPLWEVVKPEARRRLAELGWPEDLKIE